MIKRDVIFVDCFNTIILRKLNSDEVIYKWLENVGNEFDIAPQIIYRLYSKCKILLSIKKFCGKMETEVSLIEILDKIGSSLQAKVKDLNKQDFIQKALSIYIETESCNHRLNEEIIVQLKEYKRQNYKIYVLSDFYCSKNIIEEWLERLGVKELFDDIFVSCDYKTAKSTGGLYRQVIKLLKIKRSQVIMMGDNLHSDVFMARLNGLKAKHIKSPKMANSTKSKIEINKYNENYKIIFNEYGKENNFSNYAFPLFVFIKRLYKSLKEQNVKNVFFLSREGQYLKKMFDNYCLILKQKYSIESNIETHYLYASRNSLLCAGLKKIEEEDFHHLFQSSSNMSIKNFLRTLNFKEEEIHKIEKNSTFDINKKIKNLPKSKIFNKLKKNEDFLKLYEEKRESQKVAFKKYLNSFNVDFEKEGLVIVDIGWKGTMQSLFNKCFDNKIKITGYYVGNKSKSKPNDEKMGLLYDKYNKGLLGNNINKHTIYNYEQICRADHNRCDGYLIKDDQVVIDFDDKLNDVEIYKKLTESMQKLIMKKFVEIANSDYFCLSNIENVGTYMYYNLIVQKSNQDWEWLFNSQDTHHDNFGDVRYPFKIISKNMRKIAFKILDKLFIVCYYFQSKKILNYKSKTR